MPKAGSLAAAGRTVDREILAEARRDLAAALRLAHRFGLSEGICNHFSFMLPGHDDLFLLNPFGRHWAEMRARDILLIDAEGKVLEGEGEPELTALCIHAPVHQRCRSARAVLHTHMPYATAMTMLEDQRLLPLHQTALRFWNEVAYDETFSGLAQEWSEGERLAGLLGDRQVLFMANHGVLVTAPDIALAFDRLYYLERACQQQVNALQTGQPLRLIGENIAGHTAAQYHNGADYSREHFAALKRLLDRDGEDYAA